MVRTKKCTKPTPYKSADAFSNACTSYANKGTSGGDVMHNIAPIPENELDNLNCLNLFRRVAATV